MYRCLIACALLLSGCGTEPGGIIVPPDLLIPAPGWTGPVPRTAGELMDAVAAEKRGRELANARIGTLSTILD
jgi:hypothetical protein